MALRQYDIAIGQDKIGISETGTVTAVSGGASSLGGTTAVRILIDDAVCVTREQAYEHIEIIVHRLLEEATWPPS